ncbi:hypothetical protein AC623_14510 [Bacillus sp. FJAT-27231]|nr:hypothetical protein AC623_14510 [Bacillus sp. FJAT-27231]
MIGPNGVVLFSILLVPVLILTGTAPYGKNEEFYSYSLPSSWQLQKCIVSFTRKRMLFKNGMAARGG